jgi:hypothetical protein
MPTYEYLMILDYYETNWHIIQNMPESNRPPTTNERCIQIWRPGAVQGERRRDDRGILAALNELGQEGWKLVEHTITHSRVATYLGKVPEDTMYGQTGEIGVPVLTRYIMMKEAS